MRAMRPSRSLSGRGARGRPDSITRRGSTSVRSWPLRTTGNATAIGCSRPRFPCATGYGRRADMRTLRSFSRRARSLQLRARQGGTILIIALIWLVANLGPTLVNDNHQSGTASKGYFSSVPANDPDWYEPLNWSEAGQLNNGNPDAGGNVVFFLIHRLCPVPNCDTSATCGSNPPNICASTLSTAALTGQGSDQTRPTDSHTQVPATHYRVTAKAVGPRNSISIVQSLVKAFN